VLSTVKVQLTVQLVKCTLLLNRLLVLQIYCCVVGVNNLATVAHISEGKPLVLLQLNCRNICNIISEIWNLIDTYNPDVVIGTKSRLIDNSEFSKDDYITFRGVLGVVDYSFALKTASIAGCYGLMRLLR